MRIELSYLIVLIVIKIVIKKSSNKSANPFIVAIYLMTLTSSNLGKNYIERPITNF